MERASSGRRARAPRGARVAPIVGGIVKTAVVVRHVPFEDLDSWAPLLETHGFRVRYLEAPSADLSAFDPTGPALLVLLGGPIGAHQDDVYPFLVPELRLLERRLGADRPTLGICLGAQLMARALGGRVYPGEKELGVGARHADGRG